MNEQPLYLYHCIKPSCVSFHPNPALDLAAVCKPLQEGLSWEWSGSCEWVPLQTQENGVSLPTSSSVWVAHFQRVCMHNVPSLLSMSEYTAPMFCLWHRLISHQLQSHSHRCLVAELAHKLRTGDVQIGIKQTDWFQGWNQSSLVILTLINILFFQS